MKKASIITFVINLVKRDMKEYSVNEKEEIDVYNEIEIKYMKKPD